MNIARFEEISSRIEEAMNPKIYADDSLIEALFNLTEVSVLKIEDSELKRTFLRMFNDSKSRTQAFNNNQKLLSFKISY